MPVRPAPQPQVVLQLLLAGPVRQAAIRGVPAHCTPTLEPRVTTGRAARAARRTRARAAKTEAQPDLELQAHRATRAMLAVVPLATPVTRGPQPRGELAWQALARRARAAWKSRAVPPVAWRPLARQARGPRAAAAARLAAALVQTDSQVRAARLVRRVRAVRAARVPQGVAERAALLAQVGAAACAHSAPPFNHARR